MDVQDLPFPKGPRVPPAGGFALEPGRSLPDVSEAFCLLVTCKYRIHWRSNLSRDARFVFMRKYPVLLQPVKE